MAQRLDAMAPRWGSSWERAPTVVVGMGVNLWYQAPKGSELSTITIPRRAARSNRRVMGGGIDVSPRGRWMADR